MALVKLSPVFNAQIIDENGNPANGWKINTYIAGTSIPAVTYTDSTGLIAQSNPIIINSLGFTQNGQIWLIQGVIYKLVLTDSLDVVKKTEDNISGVNDTANASDEWLTAANATFISASSYSIIGDQTSEYHIGRRNKFTTNAGTVYGRITASLFSSGLTTVTVQMDGSQILDIGLSVIQNSILRNNVLSLPERIATTTGTNTYTATVGTTRLVLGDEYKLNFAIANDGAIAPTLNIDGLGARALLLQNGAIPVAGQINGEHKIRDTAAGFIILNPLPPVVIPIVVRQSPQYGPITGNPAVSNLVPQSQINNTLAQGITVNPTPAQVLLSIANGFNADGSDNNINVLLNSPLTITGLAPSTTTVIAYDKVTNTLVKSTVLDTDTKGGTPAITNGLYTLDYFGWKNYLGNGAAAVPVQHLILLEVDTDTTKVIAIRCRAYKGQFEGAFATPLPGTAQQLLSQSNVGTPNVVSYLELKCLTADAGVLPGVQIKGATGLNASSFANPATVFDSRNNTSSYTANGTAFIITNSGGSATGLTAASWGWRHVSKRAY